LNELLLEIIDNSDNTDDFDCGDDEINYFLKNFALSNQSKKFSNTYILHPKDSNQVIAYFSILASQLNTGDARIYGIDKIPVVLLGRMGVDKKYRGNNIGRILINDAVRKSVEASRLIACRFLLVETSLEMKSYYLEKLDIGFENFRDKKKFTLLIIDLLKYENILK